MNTKDKDDWFGTYVKLSDKVEFIKSDDPFDVINLTNKYYDRRAEALCIGMEICEKDPEFDMDEDGCDSNGRDVNIIDIIIRGMQEMEKRGL